ncbi:MAG: hypothetical protein ACRD3T_21340 [Terriglobia bacterium]
MDQGTHPIFKNPNLLPKGKQSIPLFQNKERTHPVRHLTQHRSQFVGDAQRLSQPVVSQQISKIVHLTTGSLALVGEVADQDAVARLLGRDRGLARGTRGAPSLNQGASADCESGNACPTTDRIKAWHGMN